MNRMVVKSRVGSDGVLHLALPVGVEEADREVQITVEALPAKEATAQEEWAAWVESMAGAWQGDFERPLQGEFEVRDPLG